MQKPLRKIFMIDDSPEDRAVFRRYLREDSNFEYEFFETETGADVLEICHREMPDCILLDYNLPDRTGIDIIREIVREFGENKIPIVMLSGSTSIEMAVEALQQGAHDFLVKGNVTPVELRLEINNAIEKVELRRERNRTKKELRESEERLSLAFESAELGLWDWDVESNAAIWRGSQASVLGNDRSGLTHRFEDFLSFIHPDDRHEYTEYMKEVLEERDEFFNEFRVIYPNGEIRWLVAKGKVFRDENGKPKRLMGINYDITRRKDLEKEKEEILLREKVLRREAEAANRAKDEFLAVLSHELRSPLNSMLGWARMLRTGSLDEERSKHAIAVIEDNIRLQNSLIEDILDVSRIIGGKMNLELAKVNFGNIVKSAIETARPSAEAKEISIESEIEAAPSEIEADSARLLQVVGNLLTNAIKFTGEGGAIFVRLENSVATAKLSIIDTGIGIDDDKIKHIFDRFRQVDSSTKRNYSGLGLGLAIVKSLVEMHGGQVSAFSAGADRGATFTIEIPLLAPTEISRDKAETKIVEEPDENAAADRKLLEDAVIFVVDDDVYSLELMEYILENQGAEIHTFSNASDSLLKLEHLVPDLLISDIGMSKMDGLDLIREVRKKFDAEQLPAIALTAFASLDDREKVISAGFQIHFPKPIDIEELPLVVKDLINGTKNK